MTINEAELRKLAENASSEEGWKISTFGQLALQDRKTYMLMDADAQYIRAARPSAVLALLDKIATLTACVKKLEASVCDARGELAYSAGDWRQALYMAAIRCGHCISDDELTLYRDDKKEGNALSQLGDRLAAAVPLAATPAQPIAPAAAVSAPTDERAAFEAVARTFLPVLWANPIRLNESYADKELRTGWEFWQAARAAAPVSGQGATLPDLPAPTRRGYGLHYNADEMSAYGQLCIDSRPRSEDSRAKVLEEAAQACESERVEEVAESDASYNFAIKHAAAAIRALASTPPKADNE